jgi:hypothetical protein
VTQQAMPKRTEAGNKNVSACYFFLKFSNGKSIMMPVFKRMVLAV